MNAHTVHPHRAEWPWVAARALRPMPAVSAGLQWFSAGLSLPFDALRAQHAEAVHAGLMANSILESRDFEKSVVALEHVTLGPFARQV